MAKNDRHGLPAAVRGFRRSTCCGGPRNEVRVSGGDDKAHEIVEHERAGVFVIYDLVQRRRSALHDDALDERSAQFRAFTPRDFRCARASPSGRIVPLPELSRNSRFPPRSARHLSSDRAASRSCRRWLTPRRTQPRVRMASLRPRPGCARPTSRLRRPQPRQRAGANAFKTFSISSPSDLKPQSRSDRRDFVTLRASVLFHY